MARIEGGARWSGVARSNIRANSSEERAEQLVEHSITGLLDEWAESETFAKLREWDQPSSSSEELEDPESAVSAAE